MVRSQFTERGPLGLGPIQFLMDCRLRKVVVYDSCSDKWFVMCCQCLPSFIRVTWFNIWVFLKIGVPQNRWFILENSLKWMIWGYHYFWKHPFELDPLPATSTLSWVLRKRAQRHLRDEEDVWFGGCSVVVEWFLHYDLKIAPCEGLYLLNKLRLTNFSKKTSCHSYMFFFIDALPSGKLTNRP